MSLRFPQRQIFFPPRWQKLGFLGHHWTKKELDLVWRFLPICCAALVGYPNLSIAPYFLVLVNCGDETTGAFALRVHPFSSASLVILQVVVQNIPLPVCFGGLICLLSLQTQCGALSLASCQERRANLIMLLLAVRTFSSDHDVEEVCGEGGWVTLWLIGW